MRELATIFIIEKPKESIHFYKGFREPIYAPHNELIGFRTYNKYYIWDFEKFMKYYKYNPDLGCMEGVWGDKRSVEGENEIESQNQK